MTSSDIRLEPLSEGLGVEVLGLELAAPFHEDATARLRAALRDHALLLVRDQAVSAADQRRFAEVFGRIVVREAYDKAPDRDADTQHVSNTRADGILGAGELDFHADQLFQPDPLKALILYAIETPPSGGDTRFTSAARAYEVLPEALKARIASLSCLHLYDYQADFTKRQSLETATRGSPRAVHPLVWTDAETGRKAIWVNRNSTIGVVGLPPDESAALIEEVRAPLYDEAWIYTHRWKPRDLLIWSNRVLQHARTWFDPSQPRTLRRTPLL